MNEGTYRIRTLGCRVNRADSLEIERGFRSFGYRPAPEGVIPEILVVNTCAVTAEGARKSRKEVRRCSGGGSKVVATGCAVEMDPDSYTGHAGVYSVVPNSDKSGLARLVCRTGESGTREAMTSLATPCTVRIPLKIQDGCSRFCTYCVVPYLRGAPYSRDAGWILTEVRRLEREGVGEVNICGIDLGSYIDPQSGDGLDSLVLRILEATERIWVRLSSIEISDVSDTLLDTMKDSDRLCSHLHIPMQSGDPGVLRDMRRNDDTMMFRRRVRRMREAVPDLGITTDVMVGFPSETDRAFANSRDMLRDLGFSRVHVFRYSPREGTKAWEFGDPVGSDVKRARAAELRDIGSRSAEEFNRRFVGRIIPVMVEERMKERPGHLFGRASNYVGVVVRGGGDLVGKVVPVRGVDADSEALKGEIMN